MSALEEIVRSMKVEQELLELLSPEQKEIIFLKIREEQVRRWEKSEKEFAKTKKSKDKSRTTKSKKKVCI